jgi:glycosyltransferase involved in cell wall biosynthesis
MTPLVSIIIPCYNAEPWVADAVESALSQTWPEIEVIAINDGSTDGSLSVLRRLASSKVRVIDQANRGASAARNAGLLAAKGQLIQFLDADDLLSADKLASQVPRLIANGPEAVATARWGRFEKNPSVAVVTESPLFHDLDPVDFLLLHTATGRMMHPAAWLVPAGVARKAGPWNESLSLNDDGEYFARVALAAAKVIHIPDSLSLYRSRLPDSLSGRGDRRSLESLFVSCELVAAHLREKEDSPRVRQALADYFQRLAYEVYPGAPKLSARAQASADLLGGSKVLPEMGRRQEWLSRIVGWRLARRAAQYIGM